RSIDGGATWTKAMNGLPLPDENFGRIGLALAPTRPSLLYASLTSGANGGYRGRGVWVSEDRAAAWTEGDDGVTQQGAFGGFSWYFGRVVVSPVDENDVWICGVQLLHSQDGCVTLVNATSTSHVDQHAVWVDPVNTARVYLGNDGGFFYSSGS